MTTSAVVFSTTSYDLLAQNELAPFASGPINWKLTETCLSSD